MPKANVINILHTYFTQLRANFYSQKKTNTLIHKPHNTITGPQKSATG